MDHSQYVLYIPSVEVFIGFLSLFILGVATWIAYNVGKENERNRVIGLIFYKYVIELSSEQANKYIELVKEITDGTDPRTKTFQK